MAAAICEIVFSTYKLAAVIWDIVFLKIMAAVDAMFFIQTMAAVIWDTMFFTYKVAAVIWHIVFYFCNQNGSRDVGHTLLS